MSYLTYAIELKPFSSIITPLQSDTIFGSLMWSLKYIHGEKKLAEVIEQFESSPPFLISNGMPKGFLVKPTLPIALSDSQESVELLKEVKTLDYIPQEVFTEICKDLNSQTLVTHLREYMSTTKLPKFKNVERVYKNVINRKTFQTLREGGFFVQEEVRLNRNIAWVVYLKFEPQKSLLNLDEVKELFEVTFEYGFGKKKSTGKGHFKLLSFKETSLPSASSANGFISISNFVPSENDPTNGYYNLITKYGKLGGEYAYKIKGPWKKPLKMLKEGAVFLIENGLKEYYGCMIKGIHPLNTQVRQYAYAFPLGVRISGNI